MTLPPPALRELPTGSRGTRRRAPVSDRPGTARVDAAQLLAEWGGSRDACDSPDAIAAFTGVAPLTKTSGRMRGVSCRRACNECLGQAVTAFADNSRHESARVADTCRRARGRGMDHPPHATRVPARARVRVICRRRLSHEPYDPARHGAARHVLARPELVQAV